MPQNVDLEIKVIKNFVDKEKQDRYIQFVSSPLNRHKFINDLAHFKFLNWDLFIPVNKNEELLILNTLRQNNLPSKTCYVISENQDIDKKTTDIKDAIKETVGHGNGTILVFGEADMVFFEGEEMNTRYISKKII